MRLLIFFKIRGIIISKGIITMSKIIISCDTTACISKKDAGFFRLPYKLLVKTAKGHYDFHATWVYEENGIHVLGKKMMSPNEFGWVE